MSATAICTNVNNEANRKPEDNGDASTMAESDVLSHSARLHDTEMEGDTVEEVVMCVVWGGCKLGLSFYSVDTGYLHTMCDVAEAEDFGLMKRGESLSHVHCAWLGRIAHSPRSSGA